MKDQQQNYSIYLPSSMWQDELKNAYYELQTAIKNDNFNLFHNLHL